MLNIPTHKTCKNCGSCCGVIPATRQELKDIEEYVHIHKPVLQKNKDIATCPFLNADKMCAIYPVRPLICRLTGVAERLDCAHGNSERIDGKKFLGNHSVKDMVLLNTINWG